MKKILTIAMTFVMIVMIGLTSNATTSTELADVLYQKGKDYGMTSADKVRMDRYLTNYPVTEEQANAIVTKADEAVKVMGNKKNYTELTAEEKAELKAIAQSAAKEAGLTLKFGTASVEILRGNEVVEKIKFENGKLAYTGNNTTAIVVVSSLAIIALVAVVAKKRLSVEG